MDQFIAVGDIAFKGGAESVSLGWTAVKWVLNAVKADAERCAQWAEASEMISRILLSCRTIGKMYSKANNKPLTEQVQQLLKDIPRIYESILTYSWTAKQQVDRHGWQRGLSALNPVSSSAAASKAAFDTIKQYYQKIRDDSQTAFHEYATEALQSVGGSQRETLLALRESWDAASKQWSDLTATIASNQKELLEEIKKLRPMTP